MKKLAMFVFAALFAALNVVNAFAAAPHTLKALPRLAGQITAISPTQLSLETFKGEAITVELDENTRYHSADGDISQADLQIGDSVAVMLTAPAKDAFHARVVVLLPEDFDAAQWAARHLRGEVWSVIPESNRLEVKTREGELLTVFVDANTQYHSRDNLVTNLAALPLHSRVGAAVEVQPDGTLLVTRLVIVLPRPVKHLGSIASVDAAAGTLTLTRRDGQSVTFTVNESTTFKGDYTQLSDLQPGMRAGILAVPAADGTWLALGVGARPAPADKP